MPDVLPRVFKRFTTRYVESEDRVRITGRLPDNAAEVVWLTQRLLQRLVPALVKVLEGEGMQDGQREVMHAWAQERARADLVPHSPIRPGPDSREWVVRTVHLLRRGKRFELVLEGTGDQRVAIGFTVKAIRQWLGILYAAYVAAAWPLSLWPDWIRDGASPLPHRAPGTLH